MARLLTDPQYLAQGKCQDDNPSFNRKARKKKTPHRVYSILCRVLLIVYRKKSKMSTTDIKKGRVKATQSALPSDSSLINIIPNKTQNVKGKGTQICAGGEFFLKLKYQLK